MQTPNDIADNTARLRDEIDLLKAMYPESMTFNPKTSEVIFKPSDYLGAQLILRLPEDYPGSATPQVVLACDSSKTDLRNQVTKELRGLGVEYGEVLDAVIRCFIDLLDAIYHEKSTVAASPETLRPHETSKTVIIWLHHLLATTKRKLALHPSSPLGQISGVTKPGYPGVMVFTGSRQAVDHHVAELKDENWQAFQVRYEESEIWTIGAESAGKGIVEVATMSEVVELVEEGRREQFLKAIGVK